MNVIPKEDLPYASLLKSVLAMWIQKNFTYWNCRIPVRSILNSGGLDFYVSS